MVKYDVLEASTITKLHSAALGVPYIDVGKRDISDRIIRCFQIDCTTLPVIQIFTGSTAYNGGVGEQNARIVLKMVSREHGVHSNAGAANRVNNQVVSSLMAASSKNAMAAARQLFSMVL